MSSASLFQPVDPAILKTTSGLDLLRGMVAGTYPQPPIGDLLGFRLVHVEPGRAEFAGTPDLRHYNPLSTVHGGYAATLLDSCMACAVHSTLAAGQGYTTIEFKVTFVRPMTTETGPVRAIGEVINVGRRLGASQGRLVDANGKVLAHGTTSCMIFPAAG